MFFTDPDREVPPGLATDTFRLRPITAADAEMDHAAVMESRDYLRLWEQSSWPEDDFTVEANRADLENLEQRHSERLAFTYTVLNPAETECLGCVYLFATASPMYTRSTITPVADEQWDDYQATVYFWVRKSQLATETDRALLETLRGWLAKEWGLRGFLVITNEQFTQQVDLIEETDLQLRFRFEEPDKPGPYLAYA
ncbi:GNAT family N-acetyltransferase [Natronoglycomyces albus]|uniref:N-acetyltransferase n=1 Tax=Natronoglycomyces albus TaxID=2811108 RepID=A0A895XU25_9ACTN|nr:hypothetical protein [Natronoglycomyces albus]QSB05750.1 hypothetical protein JQS30_02130 [Natronoglycomyces albus]